MSLSARHTEAPKAYRGRVSDDTFRLEFFPDGTLRLLGWDGWQEPTCAVCHEPIRWCLDMFSFTTADPDHRLAHARCVWFSEAFDRESLQAPVQEGDARLEDLSVGYEARWHEAHGPDNRISGCADCRREEREDAHSITSRGAA